MPVRRATSKAALQPVAGACLKGLSAGLPAHRNGSSWKRRPDSPKRSAASLSCSVPTIIVAKFPTRNMSRSRGSEAASRTGASGRDTSRRPHVPQGGRASSGMQAACRRPCGSSWSSKNSGGDFCRKRSKALLPSSPRTPSAWSCSSVSRRSNTSEFPCQVNAPNSPRAVPSRGPNRVPGGRCARGGASGRTSSRKRMYSEKGSGRAFKKACCSGCADRSTVG